MLIPESLWLPTSKDLQTSFAPIAFNRGFSATDANVLVTLDTGSLCEPDQVLLLSYMHITADPGAAQVTQFLAAGLNEGATSLGGILGGGVAQGPVAAGFSTHYQTRLDIILLSTQSIGLSALFDLGVANNTISLDLHGAIVPRGNWQRG